MVRIHEGPPTISLREPACQTSRPSPTAIRLSRLTSSSRTPPGISIPRERIRGRRAHAACHAGGRQPVGRRQPRRGRRHGGNVASRACHGASMIGPLSTVDRVHSGSVRISEVLPSAQAGGEAPSRVFEQRGRSFFSSLRLNGQEIRQIAGPSSGPARRLNLGSLRRRGLPRWTWMPSGKGLGERSFRPPG